MEPDILYVVRPSELNLALKLSLRSLGNLPHRRVFIAGYCPEWVRGVTPITVRRRANKFDAIEENARQGFQHPELSDEVVYMNDDFYFTRPVDNLQVMHGGPIDQYTGMQELKIRMRNTLRHLQEAMPTPTPVLNSHDGVHTPFPVNTHAVRESLSTIPRGCLWRTWHGNRASVGGVMVTDTKARGPIDTGAIPTFLSTSTKSLRLLRDQLDQVLPQRSPYVW